MQDFGAAFGEAFGLLFGFDPALMEIIGLSLRVSLTAVLISALIGLPLLATTEGSAEDPFLRRTATVSCATTARAWKAS